ncbi:GGDEF domain-containing protein [Xanthobacter sp. TB0139]|uniref:GGDEF domain-containing protein n=1 Tax=Xanthobacter sp. TB0139 TaxID=3459178 RepID=UPI004039D718
MVGTLVNFAHSVGIMALVAMIYGGLIRWRMPRAAIDVMGGLCFGTGAILSILSPIQIAPGVVADMRSLFIGFGAAYSGPIGAAVTVLMASGARLSLGGVGQLSGVVTIILTGGVGLVWWSLFQGRVNRPVMAHLLLGGLMSAGLIGTCLLPADLLMRFWETVGAVLIVFNLVFSVVFGLFLQREQLLAFREQRLKHEASVDSLTGLLNRRSLVEAYEGLPGEQAVRGVGFLVLDIDHFKDVNDTYGHATGDVVLQLVSDVFRDTVREGDIVARAGGEEFVAILPNMDEKAMKRVAERIRRAVESLSQTPQNIRVTISVGALWSSHYPDLDEALHQADNYLYQAKGEGRNRVVQGRMRSPGPVAPSSGAVAG